MIGLSVAAASVLAVGIAAFPELDEDLGGPESSRSEIDQGVASGEDTLVILGTEPELDRLYALTAR